MENTEDLKLLIETLNNDSLEESFQNDSNEDVIKEVIQDDFDPKELDTMVEVMEEEFKEEEPQYIPEPIVPPKIEVTKEMIEKIGLEEKGYLFLKKVYDKDLMDRVVFEVSQFMNMEGIYSHLQKRQDVPLHKYFVNNTYGALTNFQQIQHYYVPVIDNRGTYNRKTDVGVYDIYNADKLFPQIKSYFDLNLMTTLLHKSTGIEWKLTRTNLQIHNNVQNPNGFHFDNGVEKNIKFTIYLTDITDDTVGPPAYIESTHLNKKSIRPSQSKMFCGERGDVLISYQNGYHRKMMQKIQSTNMFLTFHFTTKSERDRYFRIV